ncbi:hypothetical protein ZHAS_00012843 [Anopheles sinensis]|uniref:Uncharacterized protein n=1 Tax=Anopheles sinensis TaxID=74873 RepID=A0A084W3T3_ANOSI|nr:hypothetical protein ZHAS_00012843 [Anopheles sinensis]
MVRPTLVHLAVHLSLLVSSGLVTAAEEGTPDGVRWPSAGDGRRGAGYVSANERFNEVLDRENLRSQISRQLPKEGRFFEEFDGSK